MLAKIIEWSVRNVFLVLLATLIIIGAGIYAVMKTPLDALPDLSDVQVIVYTEYPGQAPQVVEDQVTYPLTTALLSVPNSKVVRGFSFSVPPSSMSSSRTVPTSIGPARGCWSTSTSLRRTCQRGDTRVRPDATGVGWVYQYALTSTRHTLAELRTLQDWFVRYQLTKAEGISEIASIGGFVQQYQVTVDPQKLQAYDIPLSRISEVIRTSNADVGGRIVEMSETEYMVRGRGYLRGAEDIEKLVLKASRGIPVLLRDVARVELGPDERRGVVELDGEGEVVGGIAVARYGENAMSVIDNLEAKIEEIRPGLPEGVNIETVYDRSDLIQRAVDNLKFTLLEESIIVALVCVVFLLHVRSALVAILMLPIGILMSFIAMRWQAQLQHHEFGRHRDRHRCDGGRSYCDDRERPQAPGASAAGEAACTYYNRGLSGGRPCAVLLAADHHSLLPTGVHAGVAGGRMFSPLALTKTFAMGAAALLSVTLVPVLMLLFVRGRIIPEHKNPVNRFLIWVYRPIIQGVLRWKVMTIVVALVVLVVSILPARQLGSEFMPRLNEGTLLYMPASLPGMSITKAAELMQTQDRIIKSFPEVASVFGKAGRAAGHRPGAGGNVRDGG